MKKSLGASFLSLAVALVCALALAAPAAAAPGDQSGHTGPKELKIGAYAPGFTLEEFEKKQPVEIVFSPGKDAAKARPTLLLFWYLDCPTCVADMKHIKRLFDAHGEKMSFLTVGVDPKDRRQAVENFLRNNKMEKYRNFFEKIEEVGMNRYFMTADDYGVMETPSLFLISADGVLKYKAEREIDFDEVEKNIKSLIN